ncbi:MAG: monofunctional biosynthetic peptidoglycan transglycosylase [Bacteroidales bacterium]|nr:monofunctional biosynthetic peptidoglycan transglycosylase [Bacteroidales bacterium]
MEHTVTNPSKSAKKGITLKKIFKFILWAILIYIVFSILLTFVYKFVNPPVTILMIQRCIEQTFSKDRKVRLQKKWVDYEDISQNMVTAVVAAEDNNFRNHNGFDYQAIAYAKKLNEKKGKKVLGASTITQQMAKNVFLWLHKSYFRKGLEAWETILMEMFWDKKRIMEVYLNVIEFGDGIYGVEAASEYYFNKNAKNLTKREAALLTAVLPQPLKRNPANPNKRTQRRASMIQKKMSIIGRVRL